MPVIGFLILFPLVVALVLLLVRNDKARDVIVCTSAVLIGLGSLLLFAMKLGTQGEYFQFEGPLAGMVPLVAEYACIAASVLIGCAILYYSFKHANVWAGLLAAVQLAGSLVFDFVIVRDVDVAFPLYVDSLSLLMALIIGIIGSGICVYALGYMKDFQAHQPAEDADRRHHFFALMFLFLSAMFLIVFSNNMVWLFTGWEVTTVCSFLLIGYTRTDEAIRNSFRQIIMNLAGGIGFLGALYFCVLGLDAPNLSLFDFLIYGRSNPAVVALPVTCLAFAGLTKAAQMPFHTWLLGAMVAPTPTSALLHSSTMVKAGVFLLVKLAPVLALSTGPRIMVVLVGGLTFCLASFMAISQSNAKRVLAYSTIANLGLIVACAGVGTPEAVWAACFLILFHAIAKSLLFLCVGTAEHHIGSRDIEDMDLLFERMPRLARLMMLGIMTMFIAPFGMLVSKWATLVSFVDEGEIGLIVLLAFGSAATFMFWAKWMGKLAGIAAEPENVELAVHRTEWAALDIMAALIALCCILMPSISDVVVLPYLSMFGSVAPTIDNDTLLVTGILAAVVIILLFGGLDRRSADVKRVDAYMAGISVDNAGRTFINSLSKEQQAVSRNMYLERWFGEERIKLFGEIATALLIVFGFCMSLATLAGLF